MSSMFSVANQSVAWEGSPGDLVGEAMSVDKLRMAGKVPCIVAVAARPSDISS